MIEDLEDGENEGRLPTLSMRQRLAISLLLYFIGTGSLLLMVEQKTAAIRSTRGGQPEYMENDQIITDPSNLKEKQEGLESYSGGLPVTLWGEVFDRDTSASSCMVESRTGDIIIAGYCSYWGYGRPINIMSVSENGTILWQETYYESHEDLGPVYWIHDIIRASDDSYMLAGRFHESRHETSDVYIVNIDEAGSITWEKTYGTDLIDVATTILECPGGYLVIGYTQVQGSNYDVYVLKIDRQGELIWERKYGGPAFDRAQDAVATADGNFILAGDTLSAGSGLADAYLVKIDGMGNKLWEKTFGGKNIDAATSIVPGTWGYVVAGTTVSDGSSAYDYYIFKIDDNGNQLWERRIGGSREDKAVDMLSTRGYGYMVLGDTRSYGAGDFDIHLFLIDDDGNISWEETFGGSREDRARDIMPLRTGEFAVLGTLESKLYLLKLGEQVGTSIPEPIWLFLLIPIGSLVRRYRDGGGKCEDGIRGMMT